MLYKDKNKSNDTGNIYIRRLEFTSLNNGISDRDCLFVLAWLMFHTIFSGFIEIDYFCCCCLLLIYTIWETEEEYVTAC